MDVSLLLSLSSVLLHIFVFLCNPSKTVEMWKKTGQSFIALIMIFASV